MCNGNSQYRFLISPEYSTFADMDLWRQIESTGKNRWVGAYWQSKGLSVVPAICWSTPRSYEFCFDGVEARSIVAVGMIECKAQKKAFLHGYDAMLERVNPSAIIILGTPFSEMRGNIVPVEYQFNGKGKRMGIRDIFKKKNKGDKAPDDLSYIADMHHVPGQWHQYDFLLASQGYGWGYIVDSAEYMTKYELEHIGTISVCFEPDGKPSELIEEFNATGGIVKAMTSLSEEGANLGLGGMSKIISAPVKIVWFNQTRVIRIFTPVDSEDLLTRYAETMIRRTFGTPDEMKMAKIAK